MQHIHEVFCIFFLQNSFLQNTHISLKTTFAIQLGFFPYFHRNIFTLSNIFSLSYNKNMIHL